MTTLVFVRRFLTDYSRNPVNLLLLVVVPVVFVVVVAGSLADFAALIGGTGPAVETVTAAWAAAFLAGIAMYFQIAPPATPTVAWSLPDSQPDASCSPDC